MNLRLTILTALGLLGAVSVWADEQLPVLQAGTDIYSNVTVLTVSATDVYFTYNHGKGMANAKLKSLSPDLQKHFHYNPAEPVRWNKNRPGPMPNIGRLVINQRTFMACRIPPDESRTPTTSRRPCIGFELEHRFFPGAGAGTGGRQNGVARFHRFRLVSVVHQV